MQCPVGNRQKASMNNSCYPYEKLFSLRLRRNLSSCSEWGGHYLPDHCPDLFDRKIIKRNAIDGMTTEETVKTEKSRQYQSFLFSSNIYYISLSSTIISLIIMLPLSDTMNSNG